MQNSSSIHFTGKKNLPFIFRFFYNHYQVWATVLIGVLLLMHIPFLNADPDFYLSNSRDASTDEGLYSSQIRNVINHHGLTLDYSDRLVRTPLFSALMYVPLFLSGCSLQGNRLLVLLLVLAVLWFLFRKDKYYLTAGLLSVFIVLMEYHIFQYMHLGLTEMVCTSFILTGLYFIVETDSGTSVFKNSFRIASCFSLAWFINFQYVYAIIIPLLAFAFMLVIFKGDRKILLTRLAMVSGIMVAYCILYFAIWYLPNKKLFDFVFERQLTGKYPSIAGIWENIRYQTGNLFFKGYFRLYGMMFIVLLSTGIILAAKQKHRRFMLWIICLASWILVEMHKLALLNLPTGHLISLYFPISLLIAFVLRELIFGENRFRFSTYVAIAAVVVAVFFGMRNITVGLQSYQRRTFAIQKINRYLLPHNFKNRPVIGVWAPTCTWKSGALTFPVWYNYFNDKNVFLRHNPALVITETDEDDSYQAFALQGIRLDLLSDSIQTFKVNRWILNFYWIKDQRKEPQAKPVSCISPNKQSQSHTQYQ